MNILLAENKPYDLNHIPEEVDDVYFCVLDCNEPEHIDFQFLPLIYLESFYSPCMVLKIGKYTVNVPLDWSIMVCDEEYTSLELVTLTSLNNRGFHTVLFNPLRQMFPTTAEISVVNVYADVKWFFPKLKMGNVLVMPVESGDVPLCILLVKDHAKIPVPLETSLLFE